MFFVTTPDTSYSILPSLAGGLSDSIKKSEAEAAAQRKEVEAATAARMKVIDAQGDAEVIKLKAQAEAEAYRMQAEAEAVEMKMKGYTYQQETSRQVGMEAMKNGITGGSGIGAAGALGDIAGLGIGIGAMSGVIGMTREAMNPMTSQASQLGQSVSNNITDMWDCACGQKGISGNFCNNCGAKKPDESPQTWDCSCGKTGITGNFCDNCGKKRGE